MSLPVQFTHSDRTPVASVELRHIESRGPAEPTSRLLEGSADSWAAEEWAEPCVVTVDGEKRPARLIYLFRADQVAESIEDRPWDEAAERVLLND